MPFSGWASTPSVTSKPHLGISNKMELKEMLAVLKKMYLKKAKIYTNLKSKWKNAYKRCTHFLKNELSERVRHNVKVQKDANYC